MIDVLERIDSYAELQDDITKEKILIIKNDLEKILQADIWVLQAKALSPKELEKSQNLSEEVQWLVSIVNYILVNKSNWKHCTIKQKDIVSMYKKRHWSIFETTRLDAMERVFRANWWKVTYDKSSYWDRNFDAYFKFIAK